MSGPSPKPADRRQRRPDPVKGDVVDLETVRREKLPEPLGEWDGRTVDWWDRSWSSAQAVAWTDEQVPWLYELGDSLDRYWRLMALVEVEPIVEDRFGQSKENPAYSMAKGEWSRSLELAKQLGLTLRAKLDMGLKTIEAEDKAGKSLRARAARVAPQDPRG